MKKYAAQIPFVLLIASIILFSSFLKEKPSYLGLARTIGQPRPEELSHEVFKPAADYARTEIAPVLSITQEIPEPPAEKVIIKPEKKAVAPPQKKPAVSSLIAAEPDLAPQPDTAAFQVVSKPDTLIPVIAAEPAHEQPQGKKKKKKFLFFK
jgi:hypothetical protein